MQRGIVYGRQATPSRLEPWGCSLVSDEWVEASRMRFEGSHDQGPSGWKVLNITHGCQEGHRLMLLEKQSLPIVEDGNLNSNSIKLSLFADIIVGPHGLGGLGLELVGQIINLCLKGSFVDGQLRDGPILALQMVQLGLEGIPFHGQLGDGPICRVQLCSEMILCGLILSNGLNLARDGRDCGGDGRHIFNLGRDGQYIRGNLRELYQSEMIQILSEALVKTYLFVHGLLRVRNDGR